MKKLSVLLFAGLMGIATVACKSKQEVAKTEIPPVNNSVPAKPAQNFPDSLLISYERTACFGKCPAYIVNVYQSGYATYYGKSDAKFTGAHSVYLSKEVIAELQNQAKEVGFFELKDEYGGGVSDLPWQKTYIKRKTDSKRVINKGGEEIPQGLSDIQLLLDRTLNELDWKPSHTKN